MSKEDPSMFIGSGCSPFFITSIVLSFINANASRKRASENTVHDIQFDAELHRAKEDYADEKSEREANFSIIKQELRLQNKREATLAKLQNDWNNEELKMFFKDWPLTLDINTILQSPALFEDSLFVVLARHIAPYKEEDPLATAYSKIVDGVRVSVGAFDISDARVLTFKEQAKRAGGPAIANIFAMMQSIPVIMIIPSIKSNDRSRIHFSAAVWTKESSFPLNRDLFCIDYCEMKMAFEADYRIKKIAEIITVETVIAGVLADIYHITSHKRCALFPDFAKRISLKEHPELLKFAMTEYRLLATPTNVLTAYSEYDGQLVASELRDYLDAVSNTAKAAYNQLESLV